jgi:hypothetical protein
MYEQLAGKYPFDFFGEIKRKKRRAKITKYVKQMTAKKCAGSK